MHRFDRTVSFTSGGIVFLFVLLTVLFTEPLGDAITALQSFIVATFGWFYVLAVAGFLLFALWLFAGPCGHVRLGKASRSSPILPGSRCCSAAAWPRPLLRTSRPHCS